MGRRVKFHCHLFNVVCKSVPNKLENEHTSFSDDPIYLEVSKFLGS